MDNILVNTTQNVQLQYTLAGIGLRLLAVFLDTLFKYTYFIVLYFIALNTMFRKVFSDYEYDEESIEIYIAVLIICLLPFFLYHLLCETFFNGQSLGKMIVKIKVVKLNGTQANFGSYLIRSLFRIIDDSIIGIVAIAATKKAQRLGDLVAGTTVISVNNRENIKRTILTPQKEGYKIVFPQVALFSDKEAGIIREVLDFADAQGNKTHFKLLAKKIKDKYAMVSVDMDDETFLKTLLEDYNHYQFEK